MGVSHHIDEFILEKDLMWIAKLNNGLEVFQDDERPGENPPQAWLRLKEHVLSTNCNLVGLRIDFRRQVVQVPDNMDGYFFSLGAGAALFGGHTYSDYIIGYVKDGKLYTSTYHVPTLEFVISEERELNLNDPRLIMNPSTVSV